jgi:hypothetical protein
MAAKKTKTPLTSSVGTTGLRKIGGYVSADFLPQLQGLQGVRAYTEMSLNDPVVAALIFSVSMLVRNIEWQIEAADSSPDAIEAKEMMEDVLFVNLDPTFPELVSSICTMFTYGFAPHEIVWANREELWVPAKIALRSQETLLRWEFDPGNGDPTGMWQMDWENPAVLIPMEKMLLFRTDSSLNNPEGRSILRGSYVSWLRKKVIEESEGRAAIRAAGLVTVRVPGSIILDPSNAAIKAAYETLVTNLASDRQGGILLPSDVHPESHEKLYQIEYVMADGRRSGDMTAIIDRYDKRISSTILADFIMLGQQTTGSFALSKDKTELFSQVLWAWAQIISGVFNRQLIRRMWKINALPAGTMPMLVPGEVDSPDLARMAAYITSLAGVGMPLFPDKDLEDYLRKIGGLPLAKEDSEAVSSLGTPPPDSVSSSKSPLPSAVNPPQASDEKDTDVGEEQ